MHKHRGLVAFVAMFLKPGLVAGGVSYQPRRFFRDWIGAAMQAKTANIRYRIAERCLSLIWRGNFIRPEKTQQFNDLALRILLAYSSAPPKRR